MRTDRKLLAVGLFIGFLAGFFVHVMTRGGENRFTLTASSTTEGVYKIDTKTGKVWIIEFEKESPVQ